MTETRRAGRHSAAATPPARPPADVEPDEVWVPPPYEPARPGDFVTYAGPGWEVRKTHRSLKIILAVLLVVALAAGGWWYFLRSHAADSVDPVAFCAEENAGAEQASNSFVHASVGGHMPTGVPLPKEPAWVQCRVTNDVGATGESGVWRSASRSAYEALLTAAGYVPSQKAGDAIVWVSGTNRHLITTAAVHGYLVVIVRN